LSSHQVAENAAPSHVMDNMNPAPGAGKVIRAPSLKRGKSDETRISDRICITIYCVLPANSNSARSLKSLT
ncbi:hypothetical protein L9F63_014655, partial [Diploptera punctata]